jgi:tRNA dimethylallyltransferase
MRRIKERLAQRSIRMIDEVRALLDSGLSADDLIYYGLEYKYIHRVFTGKVFVRRNVWKATLPSGSLPNARWRGSGGIGAQGFTIHWIPVEISFDEKMAFVLDMING